MKHCFLLLALFLLPIFGFAQSTSATISGGVTDPTGSFILGADVETANDATGVIYSAKTNNSGMYLVPILPPGHYHVQVSKPGFKTIIDLGRASDGTPAQEAFEDRHDRLPGSLPGEVYRGRAVDDSPQAR
jgi:Carboxypeptidase regulatory-like domain